MHQKKIEIRRIAQSTILESAARDWIKNVLGFEDYEIPALDPENGITPAALVVMMAAKRCYLAFDVGKNQNISRVRTDVSEYLDNILKSGHGCYDELTEVLTKTGWRLWPDVKMSDKLATINRSGQLEWHHPNRLVRYTHSGRMYRVESSQVDLLVTPDHKMLACLTTTKKGRKKEWDSYTLITAEKLGGKSHAYMKSLPTKPVVSQRGLEHGFGALLGFAIGDGHLKSSGKLEFHLIKTRKILWLKRECANLGLPLICDDDYDRYTVDLRGDDLIGIRQLFSKIYNSSNEKVIPWEVLNDWTAGDQHQVLAGLMESDGCHTDTGDVYYTTSEVLAGQIQRLAMQLGMSANISQAECYKNRDSSFGDKPIYRLNFVVRAIRPEVNKFTGACGKTSWVEDWSGEVFCAEVPNNTLFVRRNGKAVWSGNSVLEHVTFTYAIEGVTRVFTGEMNRHRAGVAVSEGSMRYIRMDDLGFWMPDIFQPENTVLRDLIPETLMTDEEINTCKVDSQRLFQKAFHAAESNVDFLSKIWHIDSKEMDFRAKKVLTSAFRRIIGMGVSTGGVWTMNVRALRHILALRGHKEHAEEEIYHVADLIADDMVKSEPLLFGDFEKDPVTGVWKPKYLKV